MRLIRQFYHRYFDPAFRNSVALPDRSEMEQAEWNTYIGARGEHLAANELWRTGRKVLFRNFQAEGGGEVDLVYRDRDILVFGEVKTRTRGEWGEPARAVNRDKQRLVIRGANAWLRELNQPEVLFRFDIIEVILIDGELPKIRVNESAFQTPQIGVGM